ncbi:hypothetical protein D3C77_323820 [compost metagenome]
MATEQLFVQSQQLGTALSSDGFLASFKHQYCNFQGAESIGTGIATGDRKRFGNVEQLLSQLRVLRGKPKH